MKTYTCETCGLTFEWQRGVVPRWCPDDRAEAYRHRPMPRQRTPLLHEAFASTIVSQRLAMEQAIHALTAAALARQLGWDDTRWLDAAIEALIDVPTLSEAGRA